MIKMEISLGHMVSDIALRGKWNTSVQVTLLGGSFIYSLSSFHSNQTFLSLNCITGVTISIIVFFRRNFELILSKEYMDKYSSFEIFNSKWIHNSLAIIYIPRNRWRRLVYLPNFQATAGIYTVEIITRAPKLLSTHQPRQRCDQLWLEQIASRRKIRPSDWLAHVRWPDLFTRSFFHIPDREPKRFP